jgi:uncharacterized membrane protein SpoIIM required for sporulation
MADLSAHGLNPKKTVHWNLAPAQLIEEAVRRNEGVLTADGAFVGITAPHTGRSPKDKAVVREPASEAEIWWGPVNAPFDAANFETLRQDVVEYLSQRELFVMDVHCGADPDYRLNVRSISPNAWQSLFVHNMFRQPEPEQHEEFEPGFTILHAPELVYHFMEVSQVRGMEAMYDPASEHFLRERGSDGDLQMFGFYIFNNIGIAFRTFASGLLFGVGTAFLVLYNGLLMGAAAAHLTVVGSAHTFYPFVIGHGALELPAIVMAGGTGLELGFALIAPGAFTRAEALQRAARRSVPVIYGFTTMLLGAAFLEAFWSSQHALLGATVRYSVGAALWVAVIGFVLLAGRRDAT